LGSEINGLENGKRETIRDDESPREPGESSAVRREMERTGTEKIAGAIS